MLVIPDIGYLVLPLITYRYRHDIQTAGYYLSLAISTRPTNALFAPAEYLLAERFIQPVGQPHTGLDRGIAGWPRVKS